MHSHPAFVGMSMSDASVVPTVVSCTIEAFVGPHAKRNVHASEVRNMSRVDC